MSNRPSLAGATFDFTFNTETDDGTAVTLASSPAAAVYKGNSTTESTAGVTLTVDFDGRTGCHNVRVVTSDPFYENGHDYRVVLTAGTVDGQSKANAVIARFSLGYEPANLLQWKGATPADLADTDKVPASVQHMANNVLTNAAINDGAFAAAKFASGAFDAVWSVTSRLLTAGTNIVLAKGTGLTGFNDPTAAATATAVRTELGTELGRIDTTVSSRAPESGGNVAAAKTAAESVDTKLTSDRAGYIDKLNVSGTLANTDNANTFKADVSGLSDFNPDEDGVKLAPDGLDDISADPPTAVATTFRGKLVQVWERFFGHVELDRDAGTITTLDGDEQPVTVQPISDTGTKQIQQAAENPE